MNTSFIIEHLRHHWSRSLSTAVAALFLMSVIMANSSTLHAQSTAKSPVETTIEGTLNMYLVTNYGEKMQEVDRYRKTGEGSMIAFILETDQKIDMSHYLDKEDIQALKNYSGTTLQSQFILSPDYTIYETTLYGKDFADMYANKRVRVTGTLFFPMAGWQNVTPVRMDYTKVELVDSTQGNVNKNVEESSDPMKYFFTFEDDSPERKAYAKELTRFVEKLQHDETTFDADLSAKLDELRITLLSSPDGKLKVYSWEDGDFGSTIGFHTLYQTHSNGKFHAVFMEDYYREPRKIYQVGSSDEPVYLVEYFFRQESWSYDVGVDAFSMDKTGLLKPAEIFEYIPEINQKEVGFLANLSVECTPGSPSLYYEGAWSDNFFFEQTGKDFYMPQFAYLRGSKGGLFMTDYYYRYTWDGVKFRYKKLEFNPVLAKFLPEPGWLMAEFELGDSIVRVDSLANGSYRLLLWNKDKMFSSAPELIITQGRYDATKREYHFRNGDFEYVFNTALQRLQVLYTNPKTKKVEVVRSYSANE